MLDSPFQFLIVKIKTVKQTPHGHTHFQVSIPHS